MWGELPAGSEDGPQVGVHEIAEFIVGDGENRRSRRLGDTRARDESRHFRAPVTGSFEELACHIGTMGGSGDPADASGRSRTQLRDLRLQRIVVAAVQHHISAAGREVLGHGGPDAAVSSGNESSPTLKLA